MTNETSIDRDVIDEEITALAQLCRVIVEVHRALTLFINVLAYFIESGLLKVLVDAVEHELLNKDRSESFDESEQR